MIYLKAMFSVFLIIFLIIFTLFVSWFLILFCYEMWKDSELRKDMIMIEKKKRREK